MQTTTYDSLEKKFRSLAGLATLDATDKFFFENNLNARIRDAWDRLDWPELIQVEELPVGSDGVASKTTGKVSSDILEAWNKNPFQERSAVKVEYTIVDSKIILPTTFDQSSVYVLSKKIFSEYDNSSTDIPKFLENFVISAVFADFLRGDGQHEKASIEESRAEEYLLRQIDRVEKLQQQNKPVIGTYPVNYPNGIIYQFS